MAPRAELRTPAAMLAFTRMESATRESARGLLHAFLEGDPHYRASSSVYGDAGEEALDRALGLFLARPELGFVWLAFEGEMPTRRAVGACVVCYAISTSRGTLVAKLDDVSIATGVRGQGVGGRMLAALFAELVGLGVTRVDCGCHRGNQGAWRFYERLGFRPLDEERIARLLP